MNSDEAHLIPTAKPTTPTMLENDLLWTHLLWPKRLNLLIAARVPWAIAGDS